jgi:hypothetical protein
MKKHEQIPPFPECETCKDLGDCPSPDVAMDGMGTPLPNAGCLKFTDIMRETVKRRKLNKRNNDDRPTI